MRLAKYQVLGGRLVLLGGIVCLLIVLALIMTGRRR